MKLIKFIPILIILALFNTNTNAEDCDEIKGNIVGKLFCKAKSNTSSSSGTSATATSEPSGEKKGILSKIWQRPEWTKKKK